MDIDVPIDVADLTSIPEVDEEKINRGLKLRYGNNIIYTNAGSILIAVNPYKQIEIYKSDDVLNYHNGKLAALDPHIFALAEAAYRSILEDNINQSCVISGESGAGKTESTKFILQYLCSITSIESTWIQQQILEANTILEAFGNAKTIRNDNSSRFGKFMQICFDSKQLIKGCVIQDYLLEQSRITFQSNGERNYHVLYQLVAEGQKNSKMAETFHLRPPNFYRYLNVNGNVELNIEKEAKKFESLTMAFTVLQIPEQSIDGIFKILSAILWLGNLNFSDIDGERCQLEESDEEICNILSNLLGIESADISKILLNRQINVRGNVTEIPLKLQEAKENRHAMAKALYSKTFTWLVAKINSCTNPGKENTAFLGVLDIFGFENFTKNSFEQFCINYTNEKLHKFFNHYVFALEQEIYKQEEIKYSHIEFTDNSSCVELIEKPPICILKLLTEQCHMPKGSDTAYLNNLHSEFETNPYYVKGLDRRQWKAKFGINHYAGNVIYCVEGFVDKNRDVQQDVLFEMMAHSNSAFIQELSSHQETQGLGTYTLSSRGTSKAKFTVTDNFRQQLQALIDVLHNTKTWYVRCIKPNSEKQPNNYNDSLVLEQLKYLGMLDIIRIRREGFPIHYGINDFILKYKCLLKNKRVASITSESIESIMEGLSLPKNEWQIGKTKVFLRSKAYEPLEARRKEVINSSALTIQKSWKRYINQKQYKIIRSATLKIQHAYKGWKLRIIFLKQKRAAIVIQSHLRGAFAREVASALREMRRVDEEMKKREKLLQETSNHSTSEEDLESTDKLSEEEALKLTQVANQMNILKQNQSPSEETINGNSPVILTTNKVKNNDTVDLDKLFAFLSELPDSDQKLVLKEKCGSLDESLNNYIVDKNDEKFVKISTQEPTKPPANISKHVPMLPEPTVPPPPPPKLHPVQHDVNVKKPEPIYEAVLPKEPPANAITNNEKIIPIANPEPVLNGDREQRRKHRVEKKIQEMHQVTTETHKDVYNNEISYDMLEFANNYFNNHERSPDGTIISTLTRKNKKDVLAKQEMLIYWKGEKLPTSHIHMYDPENIQIACTIFKELCKYMRGELVPERELQTIQYIIGVGIEREELRDEIFIQIIRQSTNNPNPDWADKLWLLLCLVIVAFQPSKHLFRYFVSFLKRNLEILDGKLRQYTQWCFDNCKCTKVSSRLLPPSSVEVAAMRRLGTIVCRFFFLDGRTKAIDVHPTDTAGDAVQKLADKLGLVSTEGWAIFQSKPDGEEYIKAFDYLYDVIAAWEMKQVKTQNLGSASRRSLNGSAANENRFVFKKRLFKSTHELSQDPMEISMLYAQAVYSVVKCDEFPVSEKVALQLAGLQAQVALGDPSTQPKPDYYADIDNFLPQRISKTREPQFWIPILAQAHRQYGASRNELTAKVLYLSCVMQYPLYGTTMFNVKYKGYWNYGNDLILGINSSGIMFILPEDKLILLQFKYDDIESIMLDPSDTFITVTVYHHNQKQTQLLKHHLKEETGTFELQRCFVFETLQKNEIGSLIISYYPMLSNWIMNNFESTKKGKGITVEERSRLHQNIILCRRQLIDLEVIKKPQEVGGFLRNTLRRLSKRRLDKLRLDQRIYIQSNGETYKNVPYNFWAFGRQPIPQSLSRLTDQDEIAMLSIFQAILNYSGLGTVGESVQRAEDEHIAIVQTIMEKCMKKECYINELYLQLLKQTTDHPDPNSRVNLRHWALLSLACSVVLPTIKTVRKYLISHLRYCANDFITEEGKYARFAEKCFVKTQGSRRRQWPPSREEILCTMNRRPCYARFHFMDGQFYSIEFHSNVTASEIIEVIKKKIGLHENAQGYAIYEVMGSFERSLLPDEKLTDVMSKWEKYEKNTQKIAYNQNSYSTNYRLQHHVFLFKKHVFYDAYINLDDPVEKELLYHQVLHSLRSERFPITEMEAIMLTALQAQLELGDYENTMHDYKLIARHCLPPRFVPNIPLEAVALHHQSLKGMQAAEAKKSFLNLIHSWPLHRATIYDVMQTFTSNWPRYLWLAVDQNGIHLLEHRSRNVLCSHEYKSIISYSPNLNSLMVFTGTDKKQSKVILNTTQAFQIASLIKEYSDIMKKHESSKTSKKL